MANETETKTEAQAQAEAAPEPSSPSGSPPSPSLLNSSELASAVIMAALVAGIASGLVWDRAYSTITIPNFQLGLGEVLNPQQEQAVFSAKTRRASACYGGSAACLALGLGLAGGWAGRNLKRGAIAGAACLVFGVAAAIGGAFAAIPFHDKFAQPDENGGIPLHFSLFTHAILWIPIGAVAGLALGWAASGIRSSRAVIRAAFGGAVGGLGSATVITVIGALVFPSDKMDELIASANAARWFQATAGALLIAVIAWAALREPPRRD